MRNFNQGGGNRFGGNRSGGGSKFGGGRSGGDRGPVTMHHAICNKCNKDCEVPFRPTGDKPIFCNDCFAKERGNDRGSDRGGDRFPRRDFSGSTSSSQVNDEVKKQLEFLGLKIDRLTKIVENFSSVKSGSTETKSAEVKKVLKKVTKKKTIPTTKEKVKKTKV